MAFTVERSRYIAVLSLEKRYLENFDMEVEHRAGEKHINADFLSRSKFQQCQLNHEDPKLKRNVKQFEPDEITISRIQAQERFWQHQSTDESITTILNPMKRRGYCLHIYNKRK